MIRWILENKNWVFSGVGVTAFSVVLWLFRGKTNSSLPQEQNITIFVNNDKDQKTNSLIRMATDKEIREINQNLRKIRTKIYEQKYLIAALITAGAMIITAVIGIYPSLTTRPRDCPPECLTEYICPSLVEAENCYREGGRPWDLSGFSGGRLINNEDPNQMGKATDLCLCLNFEGTGVTIIYRQDSWYGSLAVKIDGRRMEFINQGGEIKNQVERYFNAGGMGQHSLFLQGSRSRGVITIDAIRIHGD